MSMKTPARHACKCNRCSWLTNKTYDQIFFPQVYINICTAALKVYLNEKHNIAGKQF